MQQKYEAVGSCIFCQDFVGPYKPGQLTDEHVIAYSLGGEDILPMATCAAHQTLTAKLEEHVACDMLKVFRHAYGLPSRSGTGRRLFYKIPVQNKLSGITFFQDVPVSEMPAHYIRPHLITPGLLVGAPATPIRMGHVCHCDIEDRLRQFMRKLPGGASVTLSSDGFILCEFARVLAKIAHTYATAELGFGNFAPVLFDIIEGIAENPFHFVGGFEPSEAQEQSALSLREETKAGVRYAVASISLKSLAAMPRFQVVVGTLIDPPPFPKRSRKAYELARQAAHEARVSTAKSRGVYGKRKTRP